MYMYISFAYLFTNAAITYFRLPCFCNIALLFLIGWKKLWFFSFFFFSRNHINFQRQLELQRCICPGILASRPVPPWKVGLFPQTRKLEGYQEKQEKKRDDSKFSSLLLKLVLISGKEKKMSSSIGSSRSLTLNHRDGIPANEVAGSSKQRRIECNNILH